MRIHATMLVLAIAVGCGRDRNAPVFSTNDPSGGGGDELGNGEGEEEGGAGNQVAACEDLEDTLADCVAGLAGSLSCDAYTDWPCDLTPYFECVGDAYGTCANGYFPDADPATLMECVELAQCE